MQALTIEGLRSLASAAEAPCVSLYLPTHSGGTAADRAKLEGLVRRARKLLEKSDKKVAVDALLAPVDPVPDEIWKQQPGGLAVFLARGFSSYFQLPVATGELLVVSDSFHIRPLLQYLASNQHYFVLLFSPSHVGFLKGSAEGVVPVLLPELPRTLQGALGEEDRERSVNYHFGARGGKHPIYGGGGKADSSRDEDLARFARAVDGAIWSVLRDEKAPLLVAASERDAAFFRSVTRYAHVAAAKLKGDLGRATLGEIHAHAWPAAQSIVQEHEGDVLERYDRLLSRARALDDVRAIAKFALQGRVRDLLLDRDRHVWGRLDRQSGDVALFAERSDERAEDVLDDVAEAVILRGGDVWSLQAARMPTKSPVAATLRW
jgi:hypothetical protein